MSQRDPNLAPLCDRGPGVELRIPGKVFVLGEYNVLAGRAGLIGTLSPPFIARAAGAEGEIYRPHPESPAGLLFSQCGVQGGKAAAKAKFETREFIFEDPRNGRGGLGGSTAEFLAGWSFWRESDVSAQEAWRIWAAYQELHQAHRLPPSGADLVAQILGGVVEVRTASRSTRQWLGHWAAQQLLRHLHVWSATGQTDRKVRTHEHLAQLSDLDFILALSNDLDPRIARGLQALEAGDARTFGSSLTGYAEALAAHGLEHPSAREERELAMRVPGVLGCKGTGALLADGLVVLWDPTLAADQRMLAESELDRVFAARSLQKVSAGEWFPERRTP